MNATVPSASELPEHDTLVFRFRLKAPLNWERDCDEVLYQMNQLWNDLVTIERETRTRYRQIMDAHGHIAPLEAKMTVLREEQAKLRAERKRLKRRDVNMEPDAVVKLSERLKQISREIVPLFASKKALKESARKDLAAPLAALEGERVARVKSAREQTPLWWSNANAVMDAYSKARSKAIKEGGELQYRRFTHEGRFVVQIQGGESVEKIIAGRCSTVRLDVTGTESMELTPVRSGKLRDACPPSPFGQRRPWRQNARPIFSIAIYTRDREQRLLSFPLIDHRQLPPDAIVQEVTVTRHRVAKQYEHHAIFRLRLPARPFAHHPNPERRCAINLGFRQRPILRPLVSAGEGLAASLARIKGEPGKLMRAAVDRLHGAPKHDLRIAYLREGERWREIRLPGEIMWHLDLADALRGVRDERQDALVTRLREIWQKRPKDAPAAAQEGELTPWERLTQLLNAPRFAAAQLASVVLHWQREPYNHYWPEILTELNAWRRCDKLLYEFQTHTREHALKRRSEYYRRVARDLAQEFGEVRVGDINLKELVKLEKPTGEETELHKLVRRNRTRAALYELQMQITQQCAKSGSVLIHVSTPYTTSCHRCGQSIAFGADLMGSCPAGHNWDQDDLAARNILDASPERFSSIEGPEERQSARSQALTRARARLERLAQARRAKRSEI